MAEWLYEEGIGENRAILVEEGRIVEAAIELPGTLRTGAVVEARLAAILIPGRRGILRLADGGETLIEPIPKGLTEGAVLRAEIVREGLSEPGRDKLPRARATQEDIREGLSLCQRIGAHRILHPHDPDLFEEAGWSELIEEAVSGEIAFDGGGLRMSLTPAMTLFDVDGWLPLEALAVAGAAAAAQAIRRLRIGGSIGLDLPTVVGKAARTAAAQAVDNILPQPFERTAVNGFGFLQIVRRRERPSLPELLRGDRAGAAARALLRRAERAGGGGLLLTAAPPVIARIEREPHWLHALSARCGGALTLQADASLAISAGHVQSLIR